jgi:hypothetical protein
MARKRSSRRPVKKATRRKTTAKRKTAAKKKPVREKPRKPTVSRGPVTREVPVAGAHVGEPSSVHITEGTIPPPTS